jgi:hypothetical protein
MNTGTCPVCNGSKLEPDSFSIPCQNCGGQTMSGKATGTVPLNRYGEPCEHHYIETGPEEKRVYGWHVYTCQYCGDQNVIDSGD